MSISVNEKCTLKYEQDFTIAETLQAPLPLLPLKSSQITGRSDLQKVCVGSQQITFSVATKNEKTNSRASGVPGNHCRNVEKAARDHGYCGRAKY